MCPLQPQEFLERLDPEDPPFVGFDIAENRQKGLRFFSRTEAGCCELIVRFRRENRILHNWPFLDLDLPDSRELNRNQVKQIFDLDNDQADVFAYSLNKAKLVAVDAPRGLPAGGANRESETYWHRLTIQCKGDRDIKPRQGGVHWTPKAEELEMILRAYFSQDVADRPTTKQITRLGQILWMFVGFWIYELLNRINTSFIEVYPSASRIACQEIWYCSNGQWLKDAFDEWSNLFSFDEFIHKKSESNDAAIGSFTAFLHERQLTQELAPNEIVIPRRPSTLN